MGALLKQLREIRKSTDCQILILSFCRQSAYLTEKASAAEYNLNLVNLNHAAISAAKRSGPSLGGSLARLLPITLLILILIPALGVWFIAQRALPVLDGVQTINALYRLVTVKFDERLIPYIEASSDGDAYFVQGYITAAQRMFQMDILRRTAEGKLAEIFGTNNLSHDKLMRTIGLERLATAEQKKIPPQIYVSLQSYTRGVNAYLATHENKLPLPFVLLAYKPTPWREVDSLAILKYCQYQMDESWQLDDLRQRILEKFGNGGLASQLFGASMLVTNEKNTHESKIPQVQTTNLSPSISSIFAQPVFGFFPASKNKSSSLPIWGSNAWAIAGSLSESKGALLACDKHNLFSSPDHYHLCSITSPKLHMAGATISGVPGILIGRNTAVAWASTDLKADGQDLVLEQFSPQFPNKYKVPTGWQAVTETLEEIPVRFANPLVHKVLLTKDGPLLSRTEDAGVALSWASADQPVSTYETFWRLNRSANLQAVQATLQTYAGSAQSFVYADNKGVSAGHVAGTVALHGGQDGKFVPGLGAQGTTIGQGWLQNSNWPETLKFSQLPGTQANEAFAVAGAPFTLSISSPFKWQRATSLLTALARTSQKLGLPDSGTDAN